ncbi:MAG: hypothetical protein V1733_01115 [bacterium]
MIDSIRKAAKDKSAILLKNNSFYIELLGNAIFFGSLNYERVLVHSNRFYLTARIGGGYGSIFESNALDFPVLINTLFRVSRKVYLEVGVETTLSYSYGPDHYGGGFMSSTFVLFSKSCKFSNKNY